MRKAFLTALIEHAEHDDRVVLLTGDLGFMVVEPFAERFPDRFINVGVAEANMVGVAAGMARQGLTPFCYSIATFATMRGYEQLRNGAVLHDLPVRIVGVGGGYAYGSAGPTHWALEDIAIMRAQPGVTVVAPGTDAQAANCVRKTAGLSGPVYYRLGKDSTTIPEVGGRFTLGRCEVARSGRDLALITTGAMTVDVLRGADLLAAEDVQATVVQVPCLSPAPIDDLARILGGHMIAFSVEDHYRTGGLGSLTAEVIADSGSACRLIRLGVDRDSAGRTGSEAWLRRRAGLDPESIRDRVLRQADPIAGGRTGILVSGAVAHRPRLVTDDTARTAS